MESNLPWYSQSEMIFRHKSKSMLALSQICAVGWSRWTSRRHWKNLLNALRRTGTLCILRNCIFLLSWSSSELTIKSLIASSLLSRRILSMFESLSSRGMFIVFCWLIVLSICLFDLIFNSLLDIAAIIRIKMIRVSEKWYQNDFKIR